MTWETPPAQADCGARFRRDGADNPALISAVVADRIAAHRGNILQNHKDSDLSLSPPLLFQPETCHNPGTMAFHGSCAAFGDDAVLLLGPPSSGKSDLLLRLLDRGFELVGDDQLVVENGRIRSAAALSGLIELHGLGIFQIPYRTSAMLRLAVALSDPAERLPMPGVDAALGVPAIVIAPETASAAIRVHWALDAACGRKMQHCGAFAA